MDVEIENEEEIENYEGSLMSMFDTTVTGDIIDDNNNDDDIN